MKCRPGRLVHALEKRSVRLSVALCHDKVQFLSEPLPAPVIDEALEMLRVVSTRIEVDGHDRTGADRAARLLPATEHCDPPTVRRGCACRRWPW